MRIQDSNVSLYASRAYSGKTVETERAKAWIGSEPSDSRSAEDVPALAARAARDLVDTVEVSSKAKGARTTGTAGEGDRAIGSEGDLKTLIIERLLEALTGKKIKIVLPGDMQAGQAGSVSLDVTARQASSDRQAQGWGFEYDYHKSEHERETTDFSASGVVRTTEGKEIGFRVEMSMSREFMAEQNISIRAGDAIKIDPLVINFAGTPPALTADKFDFDLDSDGTSEQVSFLAPGAGFLSLDSNGNGTIDNGSELFGPGTGSGFGELSAFDSDDNGWIDESDPVFTRLRVWARDAEGSDVLATLKEMGIGAIYLGRVNTPFSINDGDNESLGSVRESGVYLNEDGSAGTIQEIDLTV